MIDVLIRSLDTDFGYHVWVFDKDAATGQIRILHSPGVFEWKDHPMGDRLPKPLFSTSIRDGDIIFDKFIERLREMGYGKDKLSIESGELKATKEHLKDMQKLVFEQKPPPPIIWPSPSKFGSDWVAGIVDTVSVRKNRVRRAAKQCQNAKGVLAELFPEVFGPGWECEAD